MSQKKHIVALGLAMLLLTVGALLLAINLYGLTQTLRPAFDEKSQFRFPNDFPLPIKEAKSGLLKRPGEGEREYAERLTVHVAQSVAHIEWLSEYDLDRYHQRVPLWENFILHFMGRFSGIPEYERYHYSDYDKALERGVGVCGDVSIILSEVLREQGINAQIVSYPGHVVVAARFADGEEILLDPDFGVILPFGTGQLPNGQREVRRRYLEAGYRSRDADIMQSIYRHPPIYWDGVEHFITKKYYFEHLAYGLKWLIPILLILLSGLAYRRARQLK